MAQALESIAMSAEGIAAGNYATLDVYTSGAMAMYHCNLFGPCYAEHERRRKDIEFGNNIVLSGSSTPNTAIFKETIKVDPYGLITNIYSHHDHGPGRKDLFNFKP